MNKSFNKDKRFVGRMFDEISPAYDRMNHIMSAGQDLKWRKKAVKYAATLNKKFDTILDLAAGSGDFGREFMKLDPKTLFSVDLSSQMLKINRSKIKVPNNYQIRAEAGNLPFNNNSIDLCGISFGVRNFDNLEACMDEISRVLHPKGLLIVIEMFKPLKPNIFNRIFKLYFSRLVPIAGNMMSRSKYAYNYLHDSVDNFTPADSFINIARRHNLILISKARNFSDIVYTLCFEKP